QSECIESRCLSPERPGKRRVNVRNLSNAKPYLVTLRRSVGARRCQTTDLAQDLCNPLALARRSLIQQSPKSSRQPLVGAHHELCLRQQEWNHSANHFHSIAHFIQLAKFP